MWPSVCIIVYSWKSRSCMVRIKLELNVQAVGFCAGSGETTQRNRERSEFNAHYLFTTEHQQDTLLPRSVSKDGWVESGHCFRAEYKGLCREQPGPRWGHSFTQIYFYCSIGKLFLGQSATAAAEQYILQQTTTTTTKHYTKTYHARPRIKMQNTRELLHLP